jgi:hypothetical protein
MLGIVKDITKEKEIEEMQILRINILNRLNLGGESPGLIKDILNQIKEYTGLEAVGIRLKEGPDYPYFVAEGFPEHFVKSEKYLCSIGDDGRPILDSNGTPLLECMCGNVIQGRTNPVLSHFTDAGSFWTNSTTELLAGATEEDLQGPTRNRCNEEGYESVALIPLHSGMEIVGLLQLNDSRPQQFSLDMIKFFEKLGSSIGIAFSGLKKEDRPKESDLRYHE